MEVALVYTYIYGVLWMFFAACVFFGVAIAYRIVHYANIYRKHAKCKKWFWEGFKFVTMNVGQVKFTRIAICILALSIMSFGAVFFVAGLILQDKYNIY